MILDASRIALVDGTEKAAVDVLPGAKLRSQSHGQRVGLANRAIVERDNVLCLVLSNGRKLCGSTDQQVAMIKDTGRIVWRSLSDMYPGDRIRGDCDGVTIVLTINAVLFYPKHRVRLIGLVMDRKRSFIAEGVSCR